MDEQVKIRGHRVEPAEIEGAIQQHRGMASCLVGMRTGAAETNCSWPISRSAQATSAPTSTELRSLAKAVA